MISVDIAGDGKPDRVYGETRALSDDSYILFQDESVKKETAAAMTMARAADRALQLAKEAQAKHEDNITHTMPHNDFFAKVGEILAQRQDDAKFALLCCDVNGFQRIMYHYGISCSSEFLQLLASRFEEISHQNICSRVNGDYFVIFICYESHSELLKMMSRLMLSIEKIEEEVNFATQGTTSGIYLIDQKDTEVSIIMQKADLARRSIKGTIGNHYAIYTEELQENQFLEEGIIRDIGISMRNQSVEICYLPRVRGDKEHVMGCKAVPRIQMKNGTYLPLEDLRRYIDRSSDVQQLVFYVLKNVCVNQGLWKSRGKKIMPVSLDITAGQLCLNNAVERIDEIVKSNNMKPDEILFEIQEQYFLNFSDKFRMALEDLHNRGYRIIISRFGAHHTAVESVRRLPIHAIKFHGELFHKSIINDKDIIVFQKLVEMARDLGMEVSCGSISTQLQDEVARKIGCDIFEGDIYYGAVLGDVYENCFLND